MIPLRREPKAVSPPGDHPSFRTVGLAARLRGGGPVEYATAAVAYAVASVWFTWPLVREWSHAVLLLPPALTLMDVLLVVWILAWVAHALATQPTHVFDGNAFHPLRYSIASAEHLLGWCLA
jgi:hypothetical protein